MKERKIRLFISSTFRDMNEERDYLNNYIFPQISAYCHERFIEFIPIDLRWGITEEESRNALVLASCLDEIENSMPFFVGILGLCYGSQPKKEELNCARPSITKNKEWLQSMIAQGASITEIEMEYAALRKKGNCHGVFFLKEDNPTIPKGLRETDINKINKLNKLRSKIEHQNSYPVYPYRDIAYMGEMLLKEIIDIIDKEFEHDATDYERSIISRHEASFQRRAVSYFEFPNIASDIQHWMDNKCPTLLITGPAGSGTSNYMTNIVKYLRSKYNSKMLYYDFECADPAKEPVDDFLEFINLGCNSIDENQWSLLAIDNASELDLQQVERLNMWLLTKPVSLHLIIAASYSDLSTELTIKGADTITMHGLTLDMQYRYIQQFTQRYGKKLTPEQQTEIVKGAHSNDPIVLERLLQSLVNFGSFERLNDRIRELVSESNYSLFYEMMDESEVLLREVGMYEEFCSAVVLIAQHGDLGISEQDVMRILSIPMSKWVVISPIIKTFCKGNPRKLKYIHPAQYKQDVKNRYDTSWLAKVGIKAIEWWLANADGRVCEAASSIVEIYSYIWNLPMSDEHYTRLEEIMWSIMLSPDTVLSVPLHYHSILWQFKTLNGHTFSQTPSFWVGKGLSALSYEKQKLYFIQLVRIAKTMDRISDTAWTYRQLMRISSDEDQKRIYESFAMIAEGHPSMAIKNVTGFLGRVSGSDDIVLQKRIVRLQSFLQTADGANYASEVAKVLDIITKYDSLDYIFQQSLTLISEYFYQVALCSNRKDVYSNAVDIRNTLVKEQILSVVTYGHSASFYFFMGKAILYFWTQDWKNMQKLAEYARFSAYHAYGVSSFLYGRADVLWNYAYYKQNGCIYNTVYINAPYKPLSYSRSTNGLNVEEKVQKAVEQDNKFYDWLVGELLKV